MLMEVKYARREESDKTEGESKLNSSSVLLSTLDLHNFLVKKGETCERAKANWKEEEEDERESN